MNRTVRVREYEVVRLLGEGGMGRVYLARHIHLDQNVALKVISPSISAVEGINERFLLEAKLHSKLDHPNVVRVRDFFVEKGKMILVSDYCAGTPLHKVASIQTSRIQACRLMASVLDALNHAHMNGVLHGDVKPDNILVGDDGQPVVIDFGLASIIAHPSKQSRMGTPVYMSPEQIRCGPIDHRSDVYAAGVVLYELLAGQPPFVASEVDQIYRQHLQQQPPNLKDVDPSIDPVLSEIVSKALAKEPDQRYSGCGEFKEFLEFRLTHLNQAPDPPIRQPIPSPRQPAAQSTAPDPAPNLTPPKRQRRRSSLFRFELLSSAWLKLNSIQRLLACIGLALGLPILVGILSIDGSIWIPISPGQIEAMFVDGANSVTGFFLSLFLFGLWSYVVWATDHVLRAKTSVRSAISTAIAAAALCLLYPQILVHVLIEPAVSIAVGMDLMRPEETRDGIVLVGSGRALAVAIWYGTLLIAAFLTKPMTFLSKPIQGVGAR